jgi:hypothetical protein
MLCGLLAVPALAAPSLTVDFVRDGMGRPVLNAQGHWQYLVRIDPDEALFGTTPEGNGGSVAAELGFRLTGSRLISASVNTGNFGETDGDNIVEAGEGTPNPGTQIFSWETLTDLDGQGNLAPVGLQTTAGAGVPNPDSGLDEIFAAFGSKVFTDGAPKDFLTIIANKPATAPANGSLTTAIQWLGSACVACLLVQKNNQNPGTFVTANPSGTKTTTVIRGDANLDGSVNGFDTTLFLAGFGAPGIWHGGDFTGDGNVNGFDTTEFLAGFGQTGPAPGGGSGSGSSVIPEPATIVLVLLGALLAACRIRR